VSVSDGPFGNSSAIYRREIGTAGPFERCVNGLPDALAGNVDTACVDARAEHAVLVDQAGAVFASADDATSWFHLADIEGATSAVLV
jgi:hypothetical protein